MKSLVFDDLNMLAKDCSCCRDTAKLWVERALEFSEYFLERVDFIRKEIGHAGESTRILRLVQDFLADSLRLGAPTTYTVLQYTKIIEVALEDPKKCGRPISEWSGRELTDEVHKRNIADISQRQLWRFLQEADLKPHKSDYWMNPKIDDPVEHEKEVQAVCSVYQNIEELSAEGIRVISIDEKTGIQALKRIADDRPMKAGSPRKIEYEYKRMGTLCLTPGFDVATGKIVDYDIGGRRSEVDFARTVKRIVEGGQGTQWIFIADQLNTHKSETLVRFIADKIGFADDLGVKGKSGILLNRHTRAKFLTNPDHEIRFLYTPKHCSWLNQIECWFGILTRKLLKRTSFASKKQLRKEMRAFMRYFNRTMAKPFNWTYSGKPLAV